MSSPLNIWDEKEQKYVPLPCLKGQDGYTPQKGVDYFTDEDIASLNIPSVDQTFNPTSENAQSGKAVHEAINKAAAIIPGEATNSIKQNYPGNNSSGEASVSIGFKVKTYGDDSVSIGKDLGIYGDNGVNIGYQSILYNQDEVSLGRENKNYSHIGITTGYKNIAGLPKYADKQWGDDIARGAIAIGWENHATHASACVLGDHNNSSKDGQTVFGRLCAENPDAWFIIGNGTNLENRSNLLEVTDTDIILRGVAYPKKETGECKLLWGNYSTSKYQKVGDLVSIYYNHSTDSSIIVSSLSGLPFALSGNYDTGTLVGQGFFTLNGMSYPVYATGHPNGTSLFLETMVDNVLQDLNYPFLKELLKELGDGTINLQLNIQYFTEV